MFVAQCKLVVRQYVPQIMRMLQTMSDRAVCDALHLCDDSHARVSDALLSLRGRRLAASERYALYCSLSLRACAFAHDEALRSV